MAPRVGESAANGRFRVLRQVGQGGMGVVFEAHDEERQARVALKSLRNVDPGAIYRLKREFRSLADLTHPNLVALHELFSDGDEWFFTMELIDGVSLLQALRPSVESSWARAGGDGDETLPPADVASGVTVAPLDFPRVRRLFSDLLRALQVVHGAGRLHRDLKPSNVMVAAQDRVVVLDFGLATDLRDGRSTDENLLVGTAAYMAPEQAAMNPLTPAADWYAFGAVLYEVLTGRPPFSGAPVQVLLAKQRKEPPPPVELAPSTPRDLNRLCVELLRIRPEERPGPDAILSRLAGKEPALTLVTSAPPPSAPSGFVGREDELQSLRALASEARQGGPQVALVHGPSGVGKSALLRQFLATLGPDVLPLSGRCYERESVPFKALDTLVDALSSHLHKADRAQVDAVLPREAAALARVFPVLLRVRGFAEAPARSADAADLQVVRRRAFSALRELLGRLADRGPLVLCIDDLQWGDADSALLIAELLRPPDPPPLLLLCTFRDDDPAALAQFRTLLDAREIAFRDVALGPLRPEESRALAERLLGRARPEQVEALAREANGSPFILDVLGRYLAGASGHPSVEVRLDAVLARRIAELSDNARALLRYAAVAGRPLPATVAAAAAGIPDAEAETHLARLRSDRLIRTSATFARAFEPYHDRIRHAVVSSLGAQELAQAHRALAQAYEAQGQGSPEVLADHLVAAGERERARRYMLEAAQRANQTLAFDRAADLLRRALDVGPVERATLVRLADALASAGRGKEAAKAYLDAAALADVGMRRAADVSELQRKAAEQLLRTGHIDEGMEVLGRVLGELGLHLSASPRTAVFRLLRGRMLLGLRGLRFTARDESQLSPEALSRIDACWSVAIGLGMVDTIRGASFQTQHLQLALSAGEPYRLCRAFAVEAAYVATAGPKAERRADALIAKARALAPQAGNVHASGLVQLASGFVGFMVGRWRRAREDSDRASQLFEDAGVGFTWEAKNAHLFSLWSLFYLGELKELSRRLPDLQREAEDRGDRYAATSLQSGLAVVAHLCGDRVDDARAAITDAMQAWSRRQFHFQHYWGLLGAALCDLYVGDGASALKRVDEGWPQLKASQLLRIQNVRSEAHFLRAQCALAAMKTAAPQERELLRRRALSDAARLHKENVPWTRALATLVRAGEAGSTRPQEALTLFAEAEAGCRAADMAHYAASAAARHGQLLRGDAGRAREDEARAYFDSQGVRSAERMASLFAAMAP